MNGAGCVSLFWRSMDSDWLSERIIYLATADSIGIVLFGADNSEDYRLFSSRIFDAHA